MEVVALAHGVHFLHLLTTVLPPVLIPVSCGSYPVLSGSQVILKPLSRGFLVEQEPMLLKFPPRLLIEITKPDLPFVLTQYPPSSSSSFSSSSSSSSSINPSSSCSILPCYLRPPPPPPPLDPSEGLPLFSSLSSCPSLVLHLSFTHPSLVLHSSFTCPSLVLHLSFTPPSLLHSSFTPPSLLLHWYFTHPSFRLFSVRTPFSSATPALALQAFVRIGATTSARFPR